MHALDKLSESGVRDTLSEMGGMSGDEMAEAFKQFYALIFSQGTPWCIVMAYIVSQGTPLTIAISIM